MESKFFPVATVMTELSGGFPRSDTLPKHYRHSNRAKLQRIHRFTACGVGAYLNNGQLKQDIHRMSVVFMGGGS